MIYVVSGYMRTGTSMMMRALMSGGLTPKVSVERERVVTERFENGAFHPNIFGLYEMFQKEIVKSVMDPSSIDGKLIKCLAGGLSRFAAWDWRVIFMQRDYEEMRQSCLAIFDGRKGLLPAEDVFREQMAYFKGQMNERRDIDWVEFEYREVLDNPLAHFKKLKDRGWPIDAEKASSIVDPEQCRYRVENLDVGIF